MRASVLIFVLAVLGAYSVFWSVGAFKMLQPKPAQAAFDLQEYSTLAAMEGRIMARFDSLTYEHYELIYDLHDISKRMERGDTVTVLLYKH